MSQRPVGCRANGTDSSARPSSLREFPHRSFVERTLILVAISLGLFLLWRLRSLLVLIFGSIVIASLLGIVSEPLARRLKLGRKASLALALFFLVLFGALLVALFGAQLNQQFIALARSLPNGLRDLEQLVGAIPLGDELLEAIRNSFPSDRTILGRLGDVLLTIGNAIADFILIVIGAVFLAAQPRLYQDGFLKLLPRDWRSLVSETMGDSARALRLWLGGQLISMLMVGLLTWLGLAIVGVPSALALGVIAGLAEVIPYVGPILSAVPGLLLALLLGPEQAIWVLAIYVIVQQLEGNVIQPLVQQKVVTLPPLVTLFGMVSGGLLFGFLGLVFAAPAAVVAYVFIKRIYIRELLQTQVSVPGEANSSPTS